MILEIFLWAIPLPTVMLAKIYDVMEVNIVSGYLTRYNIVLLFIPNLHHHFETVKK